MEKLIKVDPAAGTFVFGTKRPDTEMHFKRQVVRPLTFNYDEF